MKTKVLKQFLVGSLAGLFISICITVVYSFIYGEGNYLVATPSLITARGSELSAFIFQSVLSMLLGSIFAISDNIFKNDNLSLTSQTVMHFAVSLISLTTISTLNHWFPVNIINIIANTVLCVFIYIIIWFAHYMYYKKQVEVINSKLSK